MGRRLIRKQQQQQQQREVTCTAILQNKLEQKCFRCWGGNLEQIVINPQAEYGQLSLLQIKGSYLILRLVRIFDSKKNGFQFYSLPKMDSEIFRFRFEKCLDPILLTPNSEWMNFRLLEVGQFHW